MMEMGTRENGHIQEDSASPIEVLHQLSQEAVRMAGEAWHSAYPGSPPNAGPAKMHRRTRSEVVSSFHRRSSSSSNFLKWKCQMQRALHWGGRSSREDSQYSSFDPEILANQKRQWYQLHSKTLVHYLTSRTSFLSILSLFVNTFFSFFSNLCCLLTTSSTCFAE